MERRTIFLILFVLFWYKTFLNLVQKVTINFIISSELLESLLTKMNGWILFRIFWKERKTFPWNWRLLKQCLKVLWKVKNWKKIKYSRGFCYGDKDSSSLKFYFHTFWPDSKHRKIPIVCTVKIVIWCAMYESLW